MQILNNIKIWHILFASVCVKLLALYFMPNLSFPDALAYIEAGKTLFLGKMVNDYAMPLHPIFVHILGNPFFVKIVNIILSVLTIILVYKLSLKIFENKNIAIGASLITAFYPYFIFYAITGLTETLYIFLLLSAFLLLYNRQFFFASVVIVLSILHRPTLDLLAPLLIFVFSFYIHKLSLKTSFLHIIKYLIVYIVLMSPWWLHQYNKYDQFVRLNLADGIVWYSGNNPLNSSGGGTTSDAKGNDLDISIFSHIKEPIARNNAMKQAAFEYIKENPDRFIELAAKKFIRFWRLWPYASEYEKRLYIAMSLLSYGIILLLSILFAFKYLKQYFRVLSPILLLIVYLTVVHMILIGSIRYRLPLEPFLIIFASYTIVNIFKKNKNVL